ncbi:MAG: HAD-IIIA family hydrolase [Bacteroidales bacterium]|nr:HAD-IIIA family hydrolase [Bacteroidales bacterium]
MEFSNFKESLMHVKAFAFDVDGVFTDGTFILNPDGEFLRMMNIKDGYAVQYCVKQGYPIAVITGGNSETIRKRFEYLGVTDIYLKSADKLNDYEDFRFKYGLEHENILYMGDDIPDYELMKKAGVPTCPADAVEEIKSISTYISDKKGGHGCVRDVIEQVLRLHGKWLAEGAFSW